MPSSHQVTNLLLAWRAGDQAAFEELAPLIESELRRLARRYMSQERPGHVLQTTALINEAFIQLIGAQDIEWQNRAQFFGIAAQRMRRILVDYARARNYAKRGGGMRQVDLEEAAAVAQDRPQDLVALDEAMNELAKLDQRQSLVVELKYFGGLTNEEAAAVLGVSVGTVKNDWSDAKTWLHRALSRKDKDDA